MTGESEFAKPDHKHFVDKGEPTEEMVNDSLGTTDFSDSTGLDESKETGDAKKMIKDKKQQD